MGHVTDTPGAVKGYGCAKSLLPVSRSRRPIHRGGGRSVPLGVGLFLQYVHNRVHTKPTACPGPSRRIKRIAIRGTSTETVALRCILLFIFLLGFGWYSFRKPSNCKSMLPREQALVANRSSPRATGMFMFLASAILTRSPSHAHALPMQASTQKLERELAEARRAAQRAEDKAAETAEHLRVSRDQAARAKSESSGTADNLKRQVGDTHTPRGAQAQLLVASRSGEEPMLCEHLSPRCTLCTQPWPICTVGGSITSMHTVYAHSLGRHGLPHLLVTPFPAPFQLELSRQHAAEAEADLRARMEQGLREARLAAEEARAKAERDLEETRQASAGGTRELTERAERREEVGGCGLIMQTENGSDGLR